MNSTYYIASCVFTSQFPELSARIRDYIRERWGFRIVRCCVPRYKIMEFEGRMPEGDAREKWSALPDSAFPRRSSSQSAASTSPVINRNMRR